MKSTRRLWPVRLAQAAEGDYRAILAWTVGRFSSAKMRTYEETLIAALEELGAGPAILGAKPAIGLPEGFFLLHVSRRRRTGRHVIVFRVRRSRGREWIEVVRILHDAMDAARHVPSS